MGQGSTDLLVIAVCVAHWSVRTFHQPAFMVSIVAIRSTVNKQWGKTAFKNRR